MPSGSPQRLKPLRELTRKQWKDVARGAYERFGEVGLTDRAATLAYYGFLSLFPGLIVGIALLALLGSYPETYESIIDTLREAAPGTAVDTIDSALRNVLRGNSAASLLGIGLVGTLITASGAAGAAVRSLEAINKSRQAASFVRSGLARLAITVALLVLMVISFTALVVAGPVFSSIADSAGLAAWARDAISLLRYPVGLGALMAALLLLYTLGPAGTPRRLVDHLPGAALATALFALASAAFSFYVANFGSYDQTYGTLGAVIVLLVWIYVGALAMLLGGLMNRELRRVRGAR